MAVVQIDAAVGGTRGDVGGVIALLRKRPEPQDLVCRARHGDTEAFERLIARHDRGLRALAFRMLADRDSMDDVLQDTYLRCFRNLDKFRGEADLRTWLYRITYNICLDELRRGRRAGQQVPLDVAPARAQAPYDHGNETNVRLDLERALARLAPADRAAVVLVCVEGFGYAEAAEVLGVAPGTVGSRLNRARAALRAGLSEARETGDAR